MKLFYKFSVVFILYILLAIPDNKKSFQVHENKGLEFSSMWWGNFAQNLVKYRITNEQNQAYEYNKHRQLLTNHLEILLLGLTEPDNAILDSISLHVNKLSALASLVPGTIGEFEKDIATWRKLLKYQSRYWDLSSEYANERLFQLLIESRLAFESALIQSNTSTSQWSSNDIRTTKSITYENLQYKSGDIIAFSAQADEDSYVSIYKELPNAYKHLACIYIKNDVVSVVYIDHKIGLTAITIDAFIKEIALNGLILRLREDIPQLIRNPAMPSIAALEIFTMAESGEYQFDHDYNIESQAYVYDWELISQAYKRQGFVLEPKQFNKNSLAINFEDNNSHISPFEIEFDHRFLIAGEWYHSNLLYKNRLLTAATTSIIENQSHRDLMGFYKLPVYRLMKGYSMIIGQLGFHEPIPSGISAQSQLALDALETKQKALLSKLEKEITLYEQKRNHKATYLKMMQKANEITAAEK